MPITITDLSAIDANGLRTVTGVVNGVTRQVSLPIAELEPLTFEDATALFIEGFRLQLASDPKPYPLPFNSITIEP
jgi:hypothetical protein